MVCKNWFFRTDWYYIGTILVCTKTKLTKQFMSTRSPALMAAAESAENQGEEMEAAVPGNPASPPKSLEAECESRVVVDVLAAEDVGRFPDQNMAEAFSVIVA